MGKGRPIIEKRSPGSLLGFEIYIQCQQNSLWYALEGGFYCAYRNRGESIHMSEIKEEAKSAFCSCFENVRNWFILKGMGCSNRLCPEFS